MRVVVIGAGAAGLVAAAEAARRHADVQLLEKNNKVGVKILMSGEFPRPLCLEVSQLHTSMHLFKLISERF